MNKLEREKAIIETWRHRLELFDSDMTTKFYARLGIFGAIFVFLFNFYILESADRIVAIKVISIVFLILIHWNNLDRDYFSDMYRGFMLSIRNESILEFNFSKRNFCQKNIKYKKIYQ